MLITGASGSGKSDLALRLMDGGGVLVADDQTKLEARNEKLFASAPLNVAGLIEVRHVGLLLVPHVSDIEVALHVALVDGNVKLERLPGREAITHCGVAIRRVDLMAFAASTPAKIRAAVKYPVAGEEA